jgi:hypothetical protein
VIAFVVMCLASDPQTCERHEVLVDATELQCLTLAQQAILPYIRAGFRVERFGCRRME